VETSPGLRPYLIASCCSPRWRPSAAGCRAGTARSCRAARSLSRKVRETCLEEQGCMRLLKQVCLTRSPAIYRLQISPHTLARAISLIEKAVEQQDRVVLRPSTVRPLLVTATLLACKDHYDNDVEWSVRRFQEALPELELGHLVDMEVNLLQALDFRVAYWNKHEWACCCCALASRLQESHQEFRAFKRSFNAMYNCRAHGNSAAASVCAKQASSSPRMRRRCREHHSSSHSSKTKSC